MSEHVDALVIGAGVVGLAVASVLARRGREVFVIERHSASGQETSSRNSGVIHSGIYYPTDSAKARLCIAGKDQLYRYCNERGIKHKRCGKLIVAQEMQLEQLQQLHKKASANGVNDLELLSRDEVTQREPAVRCAAALFSPSTGIIDIHDYMNCLEADIQAHHGLLITNTRFVSATVTDNGFNVVLNTDNDNTDLSCRQLVNCAGLNALETLKKIHGYPVMRNRDAFFAKGNYFSCQGTKPFKHLVYPMPNEAGLGVHATLDMDGTTRFGPDVEWVKQIDYSVTEARAEQFYSAIREYWPSLPDGSLHAAYSGIRPKLVGPGQPAADFEIEGTEVHGVPGLINLLGIESPGLTASLAIAELVSKLLCVTPNSH